uniref:Uncharacterized protein n=1 Tax=Glossina austeni TaxID=7395 RepID=A0A1A9VNN1_GLOAU
MLMWKKIIKSNDVIYFLLKYPMPKLVCKKLTILPIARNDKMLQLEETTIPKCNNHTLAHSRVGKYADES